MEKNVRPPIFNSDFKFPAQRLLLQKVRQAQQPLSQQSKKPNVRRAVSHLNVRRGLIQHAGRRQASGSRVAVSRRRRQNNTCASAVLSSA